MPLLLLAKEAFNYYFLILFPLKSFTITVKTATVIYIATSDGGQFHIVKYTQSIGN